VLVEPLEPGKLVVELRAGLGIAVRQVQAADDDSIDGRFDIAAVRLIRVVWQAPARLNGLPALLQDGDPIVGTLTVPDGAVSRAANRELGKGFVGCLELLQADDIGRFPRQPVEKRRQASVDAVDVESGNLHRYSLRMQDFSYS